MRFSELEAADRRLAMLRGLAHANGYRATGLLLRRYCESIGHRTSADRFAADLAWLAEQGLIEQKSEQGIAIATLTTRGLDVAEGAASVPGVSRPDPAASKL